MRGKEKEKRDLNAETTTSDIGKSVGESNKWEVNAVLIFSCLDYCTPPPNPQTFLFPLLIFFLPSNSLVQSLAAHTNYRQWSIVFFLFNSNFFKKNWVPSFLRPLPWLPPPRTANHGNGREYGRNKRVVPAFFSDILNCVLFVKIKTAVGIIRIKHFSPFLFMLLFICLRCCSGVLFCSIANFILIFFYLLLLLFDYSILNSTVRILLLIAITSIITVF